jgi:hypothetical protein
MPLTAPGPNLNQRVAVIDSSQKETLYARNYARERQVAWLSVEMSAECTQDEYLPDQLLNIFINH